MYRFFFILFRIWNVLAIAYKITLSVRIHKKQVFYHDDSRLRLE